MNTTTNTRRATGGTRAAAGTVPGARRASVMTEGAANRTDYMVDDHDPMDARQALAAADAMMRRVKNPQPAFPIIKAPFYLTLARRGQYLKVKAANDGTGMLEVLTAEASYCMTEAEKNKADRTLERDRDRLKDTKPGRAFLCAMQLAITGKVVEA